MNSSGFQHTTPKMEAGEPTFSGFDTLLSKNVPHILEKIFFSLDYESFKTCHEVSTTWNELLTSASFVTRTKSEFYEDILEDEKKLFTASVEGEAEEVERLLSSGMVNVNCRGGYYNSTPLYEAADRGNKEVAQLLLEGSADPNCADIDGETPLYKAVVNGDLDVVRLLLERGADPNKSDDRRWTPLHEAARKGCGDVVQLLIEGGADLNVADATSQTPLYWAALRGHVGVVQLMRDEGADPSIGDAWEILEWM